MTYLVVIGVVIYALVLFRKLERIARTLERIHAELVLGRGDYQ